MKCFKQARYLQCFSLSLDVRWVHSKEWYNSNEMIRGIVDPNTLEIKIPFPENIHNIYDFFKEPQNKNPLPIVDVHLIIPINHIVYHIAIAPEGWNFITLSNHIGGTLKNKEEIDTMLSKVKNYFYE